MSKRYASNIYIIFCSAYQEDSWLVQEPIFIRSPCFGHLQTTESFHFLLQLSSMTGDFSYVDFYIYIILGKRNCVAKKIARYVIILMWISHAYVSFIFEITFRILEIPFNAFFFFFLRWMRNIIINYWKLKSNVQLLSQLKDQQNS